jgi:hypothetical protein
MLYKLKTNVLIFIILYSYGTYSQCAMCRAALESEGNQTQAQAVNDGIVYLMVIPYILVAGLAFAVYKIKSNK